MQEHSFSPNKLNDAFGFATIVASVDAAKTALAHPLLLIPPMSAAFFVYFLAFRTKMYIDDARHDFNTGGPIDVGIACLSWIAFIISAGALEADPTVAIGWFSVGLIVSLGWIAFSIVRRGFQEKYAIYAVSNLIHIALLLYALATDNPWLLLLGTALVGMEAYASGMILSGTPLAATDEAVVETPPAVRSPEKEKPRKPVEPVRPPRATEAPEKK